MKMHYSHVRYPPYLMHYGIHGQKWGVRRYQYDNGSYTPEGKERYGRGTDNNERRMSQKNTIKEKYSKKEREQWLNRNFSDTWRDSKYMKEVWEIDDVQDYANKEIKKEKEYALAKQGKKPYGSASGNKPESRTWKAKEASTLSDDELNRRNSRLQRERQYKDLTTPAWKKEVSSTLKEAAKKIFITAAITSITAISSKIYRDKFDDWYKRRDDIKNNLVKDIKKSFVDIGASMIMRREIAKY